MSIISDRGDQSVFSHRRCSSTQDAAARGGYKSECKAIVQNTLKHAHQPICKLLHSPLGLSQVSVWCRHKFELKSKIAVQDAENTKKSASWFGLVQACERGQCGVSTSLNLSLKLCKLQKKNKSKLLHSAQACERCYYGRVGISLNGSLTLCKIQNKKCALFHSAQPL